MNFKDKKIAVWGLGVVGQSVIRFLHAHNACIFAIDKKKPTEETANFLQNHNASFTPQEACAQLLEEVDAIIASPGIDLRPYKQLSHKFIAELDIFQAFWRKPIVAITGSVGKTTVTQLLSLLLTKAGKKVATGGNIGVGMLDLLEQQEDCDYAVLEVSSFQLEWCKIFAPDLALWTNFHPNHLDRHGTLQNYFDAKFTIVAHQTQGQRALVPLELKEALREKEIQAQVDFFTTDSKSNNAELYCIRDSSLCHTTQTSTKKLCSLEQLPKITFIDNWLLLAAALDILTIELQPLLEHNDDLTIPAHRLELVATIGGARFYNDSKSTIPAATLAAINSFAGQQIILFVGGVSKGLDRSEFIGNLRGKVKTLYLFGAEAHELADYAHKANIHSFAFATLEQAVSHCMKTVTAEDTILFSPAGASFDLFANYQERGTYFKKLVLEHKNCN